MVTRDEKLTRIFKALGDPTRRALVDLLLESPQPVHSLAEPFSMSRPAISRHLRLLKEAGLVVERKQGRERVYEVQLGPLQEIERWAAGIPAAGGARKPSRKRVPRAKAAPEPVARARREAPGESAKKRLQRQPGKRQDDWHSW